MWNDNRASAHTHTTHVYWNDRHFGAYWRHKNFPLIKCFDIFTQFLAKCARTVGQSNSHWVFHLIPFIAMPHISPVNLLVLNWAIDQKATVKLVNHISCARSQTSGFCLRVMMAQMREFTRYFRTRTHTRIHTLRPNAHKKSDFDMGANQKALTRKMIMWF